MPSPTETPRGAGSPPLERRGSRTQRKQHGNPPDRLRKRADFATVMRKGRRARHPLLQLVARRTDPETTRVGYSVSRQVGGAVVRNRVKRRLRSIVHAQDWKSGFDLVLVARPGADTATYQELEGIVREKASKLGLMNGTNR